MIDAQSTPLLLILCISCLLLAGLVSLVWGSRFERHLPWLTWTGILVLGAGLGFSGNALFDLNQKSAGWPRGWIWPRSESGAITVGILQDHPGLAVSAIALLAAAILLLNQRELFNRDAASRRPERLHAAITISLAGVSLAWLALTPWLGFAGLTLVSFGGFLALGSRWDSDEEADLAVKFLWQRSWGIILAVLGACGLAGSGMVLTWLGQSPWEFQPDHLLGETVGMSLLLIGLFLQFQPFPLLGWLVAESRTPAPVRSLLVQMFPAWAAFSILLRLEPTLRTQGQGMFLAFGWLQLASAFLTLVTGFAQKEWKLGLGVWQAAGFSLAAAALAFSGPWAALALLLGVSLSGLALSLEGHALEAGGSNSQSNRNRARWAKTFAFMAAATATGMVGSVSAGGILRWILHVWHDPYLTAGLLVAVFLFLTLGWKLAWFLSGMKSSTQSGWLAILSPVVLIVLSLGLLWTGSFTSGAIYGVPAPDQPLVSLLDLIHGVSTAAGPDEAVFWAATGTYWVVLAVALGLAFWIARKPESFRPRSASMVRTAKFFGSGYGADAVSRWLILRIARAGIRIQWVVDGKIWGSWVPNAFSSGIRRSAAGASRADEQVSLRLRNGLLHAVEIPAKVLQLIQSGDVQWYLVFAISSGLAILVHFLRVP